MDDKKIVIKINKHTGKIEAEALNFKSTNCEQAMNFLNNILLIQSTENKPEYYQDDIDEIQQIVG